MANSGGAVSKLTAESEMEDFVAGMHASKRLNTARCNLFDVIVCSRATHRSSDRMFHTCAPPVTSTASQDLPRASRVKSTSGLLDVTAPAALTTTALARCPAPSRSGALDYIELRARQQP